MRTRGEGGLPVQNIASVISGGCAGDKETGAVFSEAYMYIRRFDGATVYIGVCGKVKQDGEGTKKKFRCGSVAHASPTGCRRGSRLD